MSHNLFVFDTNVLVSAALSPHSVSADALKKALLTGRVTYSKYTWKELLNVLFRPKFDKYFTIEVRQEIAVRFLQLFKAVEINEHVHVCRDPKDDMFLDLALAVRATCLITGDKALLELHPFQNIPILSPADFLNTSFNC
ncbi:MAG: putative toxin-antitoxin system toxin component, PIN family [Fermentimonas sp.]|jgi:putative PIN family toxin of toxin-antitoxin system